MVRVFLCLLMFSAAEEDPGKTRANQLRKELPVVERAITEALDATVPTLGRLQEARGTYLEGYGVVFTAQTMLEPPMNPFHAAKSPAEVKAIVTQRLREIRNKLIILLQERVGSLESIAPTESATIVLFLINSNPAYTPDLPAQLTFSVKKQDVLDFRAKKITDLAARINVREY